MKTTRRALLTGAAATSAMAAPALSTPAIAQGTQEWRMVTSWPKNLPGPGVTAERLAERIRICSGGRISVSVYAAGELVPALSVFDAVAEGTAEMAHTASFFWQGRAPASVFFTAVPFGLTADEHAAWIYHGGGGALWDTLYAPFAIKPFMAGNTGMQMGGWYNREINTVDDLKGLKIRMPGLGGDVMRALGATPVSTPPSEIANALSSGLIDAAEFLGPWSDRAIGLPKVAKSYYWPGFHEPNGTGEALLSSSVWNSLDDDLREAVRTACAAEDAVSRAEADWQNAQNLSALVEDGVTLRAYPDDVLAAAREAAGPVLARFDDAGGVARDIYRSYMAARSVQAPWGRVGVGAFLEARDSV
ncbi:MAG: TRAP transporter substrate-binding protein [Pseudomonadota bacterium]